MEGISISWVEIGAVLATLCGSIAFLFKYITSTNKNRIESYKQVVDKLNERIKEKEAKIDELYDKLSKQEE